MTHNKKNFIIFNNVEQHILQHSIRKFSFRFKISEVFLHIIEYKPYLIRDFYRIFEKIEAYFHIPNAKSQI